MSNSIRNVKQLLAASKSTEIVPKLKISTLSFKFDDIAPKNTTK